MGYGTSGLRLEPVKFKVFKQVMGIPYHAYESGMYETRKLSEIAMLRRLPQDHVQEIIEGSLPTPTEESPPLGLETSISEMRWNDLREKAEALGLYKVGMKRKDVEAAIADANKPVERLSKGISIG